MSYHMVKESKDDQISFIKDDRGRYILFSAITKARIFCIKREIQVSLEGVISKASLIRQLGEYEEIILDPDPKKNHWEESLVKIADLED